MTQAESEDPLHGPWTAPLQELRSENLSQADLCWIVTRNLWRLMPLIAKDSQLQELRKRELEEIIEAIFMCGLAGFARSSSSWSRGHGLIAHAAMLRLSNKEYKISGYELLLRAKARTTATISMSAEICAVIATADQDRTVKDLDELLSHSLTVLEESLNSLAEVEKLELYIQEFEEDFTFLFKPEQRGDHLRLWHYRAELDEASFFDFLNQFSFFPTNENPDGYWNEFASSPDCSEQAARDLVAWGKLKKFDREGPISVQGFLGQRPESSDTSRRTAEDEEEPPQPPSGATNQISHPDVRSELVGQQSILSEEDDSLAHRHAANAVVDFVESERTQLPLTISVEGEWGTGKSSFMNLIRAKLNRRESDFVTVWFNPWRYETVEAMWAAFAISLTDQLRKNGQISWFYRARIWVQLHWQRFRAAKKAWPVLKFCLVLALYLGALTLVPFLFWLISGERFPDASIGGLDGKQLLGGTLAIPFVAFLFPLLKRLFQWTGNPLSDDIKSYFRSPDYSEKATVLQRFHSDVRRIMVAYANGKKIALFMDDLDRCEVPVATEILRTLNLFLAVDQDEESLSSGAQIGEKAPEMVCFIGMDREKVAASISLQHEDLLPFLDQSHSSGSDHSGSKQEQGLCFGINYLEKFIHLSIAIPQPDIFQMANFLDGICGKETEHESASEEDEPITSQEKQKAQVKASKLSPELRGEELGVEEVKTSLFKRLRLSRRERKAYEDGTDDRRREAKGQIEERETKLLRECTELALPVLDFNPRRVKQFVNLFRLRIRLAAELGFFRTSENSEFEDSGLTMEQMGKLAAIELGAPRIFAAIRRYPDGLAAEVYPRFLGDILESDPMISAFLDVSPQGATSETEDRWSLRSTDLSAYFRIGLPSR